MDKVFDTRGTEIRPGSHIIYAVRGSLRAVMHEAIVDNLGPVRFDGHEKLGIIAHRVHRPNIKVRLVNAHTIVVLNG